MVNNLMHKQKTARRRKLRVRKIVSGTEKRPRLAVYISNLHVTAQIIDDGSGKTLAHATSVGQKISGDMTAKSLWVGEEIAKKAKKANITQVSFDRGSKKYHGRVASLAEAARKNGLEF